MRRSRSTPRRSRLAVVSSEISSSISPSPAGAILRAGSHDLPMGDEDAGVDQHLVADCGLVDRHRQAVGDPRQNRHSELLQTRLEAIERLPRKAVVQPEQSEDLTEGIGPRAKLVTLA